MVRKENSQAKIKGCVCWLRERWSILRLKLKNFMTLPFMSASLGRSDILMLCPELAKILIP